jgi:hypothetical protein
MMVARSLLDRKKFGRDKLFVMSGNKLKKIIIKWEQMSAYFHNDAANAKDKSVWDDDSFDVARATLW